MAEAITITRELFDHADTENITFRVPPGLTKETIIAISNYKNEPDWMLQKRLEAFETFQRLPMPNWGPDISSLDLNKITYFAIPNAKNNSTDWDELPQEIKRTFDKLGIPEAEKTALAGVGAQYESSVVYHSIKKEWEDKGVIFLDMDVAIQEHPELVKKYFMTQCVPVSLHKFVALHAAVWSGGTFLYVPENVRIDLPLQAYFRMNAKKMGQFEHTLIIVEKGAQVHYVEGCSAPQYNVNSLHAGCVEIIVKDGARARYSSVENWSKNTFNLNTKRGVVHKDAVLEWVGGNLGSGCTMLYPCSILVGENARADHIGIAFAGKNQNQDVGAKVYHLAPNTASLIKSKSISRDGGITTYRGLVKVSPNALNAKSSVQCDALMMDNISTSDTVPYIEVQNDSATVAHEATVGKIGEEQIFYLMSRGISEADAVQMIVAGFIEPVVKELPLEYAVEMNRLIQLEMDGSLG
ncbi:Fe-S cluster assembly protein SufB [Candidatus Woesearchaeota archaeon]|nr:Fe-S cluster assembly protein SufB [Candidatus Woesearchaeota archaeon]